MKEIKFNMADVYNKEVEICYSDLLSYVKNGDGTDIWVKDPSMEDGKRFYMIANTINTIEKWVKESEEEIELNKKIALDCLNVIQDNHPEYFKKQGIKIIDCIIANWYYQPVTINIIKGINMPDNIRHEIAQKFHFDPALE